MRPGRTQVETEADMNESQTSAHSALARLPKKSTRENISTQHGKADSQIQPEMIGKINIVHRMKETIFFIATPTKITHGYHRPLSLIWLEQEKIEHDSLLL
jgi:hypothetical protein